ncbi:MAG TPA: LamG domain-containing protein [Pseudomonadales bacterium]
MMLRVVLILVLLGLVTGCGSDGQGAQTVSNPDTRQPGDSGDFVYNGPRPATDDTQLFRLNLWDNIIDDNRCGQCHSVEGGQAPMFARRDDVNLAYAAVASLVRLDVPGQSPLVQKFNAGHFCWEASNSVCAELLTRWISDWASAGEGAATVVELTAPVIREPGSSKVFPVDSSAFAGTVYPLLRDYCAGCHAEQAPFPQSPFFASADVDSAYAAARSKISLDTPASSRLVVRLAEEFHNCWDDCRTDASAMQAAIEALAGSIDSSTVDPQLVHSKALQLFDGIVASSGGRNENNLIALYQFKAGSGNTAFDTSGVEPSMHLALSGEYEWVGGWGIHLINGKAQARVEDSRKLHQLITATGEYAIEAWLAPNNVTQEGPARIVSYSAGNNARNVTLGQTLYNYNFLQRSSGSDANGEPALSTPDADEVLQATLQHVVITFDAVRGRRLFVNGEAVDVDDPLEPGSLADWDNSFAFVLGSETSNQHRWRGVIRLVAVYNRALTDNQIRQNFAANVGERFLLLFSVSHLVDVADAYVVFEVSQFDNYAYLFSQPFFVSLDDNADFSNIPLQGLHIGINGKLATTGQAFVNINTLLDSDNADEQGRISLSSIGSVIALDKGAGEDEFFLVFDRLGDASHVIVDATPPAPSDPADEREQADIGLKTFDEINASMARMTGVSPTQTLATFTRIRQQLPVTEDIQTFVSAQQVAISQLAIDYCNRLVEDDTLRSSYFPDLDFSAPAGPRDDPASAFYDIDALLAPLITRMIGDDLARDPNAGEIRSELDGLVDSLTQCGAGCDSQRTRTVSKAVCAALLASASTLLQ